MDYQANPPAVITSVLANPYLLGNDSKRAGMTIAVLSYIKSELKLELLRNRASRFFI